jgi:chromosome segregation ATPase
MKAITENDLKRLEDLIINGQKSIETRITGLEKGQNDLKEQLTGIDKRLTIIETRLDTWKPAIDKIPDLAEKVGELKNWRQIVIIALTAVISSTFTWLWRVGNLKP